MHNGSYDLRVEQVIKGKKGPPKFLLFSFQNNEKNELFFGGLLTETA